MSNRQISKAYRIPIPTSSEKQVLLKLADNASDEGVCFPSLRTISRETGVKKSTLLNALSILEATGLIKRFKRYRKNGADSSTEYHLYLPYFNDVDFNNFFDKKKGILFDFMTEYKTKKEAFLNEKKRAKEDIKKLKSPETDHPKNSKKVQKLTTQSPETDHPKSPETDHATISNPQSSFNPHILTKQKKEEEFTFSLSRSAQFENLSDEYKKHLELYAKEKDGAVNFEAFVNYHGSKGNGFKNWKMAYITWCINAEKFSKKSKGSTRKNHVDAKLVTQTTAEMIMGGNW